MGEFWDYSQVHVSGNFVFIPSPLISFIMWCNSLTIVVDWLIDLHVVALFSYQTVHFMYDVHVQSFISTWELYFFCVCVSTKSNTCLLCRKVGHKNYFVALHTPHTGGILKGLWMVVSSMQMIEIAKSRVIGLLSKKFNHSEQSLWRLIALSFWMFVFVTKH